MDAARRVAAPHDARAVVARQELEAEQRRSARITFDGNRSRSQARLELAHPHAGSVARELVQRDSSRARRGGERAAALEMAVHEDDVESDAGWTGGGPRVRAWRHAGERSRDTGGTVDENAAVDHRFP